VRVSGLHVNVIELPCYELVHHGSRLGEPGGAFVGAGRIRVVNVVSVWTEITCFRDCGSYSLIIFLFNGASHLSKADLCRPFSAQILIQVPYLVYIVVHYRLSRHAFLRSFVCIRRSIADLVWGGLWWFALASFWLGFRWATLLLFFRVCFGTRFAIWLGILIGVLGRTCNIDGVGHNFAKCRSLLVWCITIHLRLWLDKWELFLLSKALLLHVRLWTNATSNGCCVNSVCVFFVGTKINLKLTTNWSDHLRLTLLSEVKRSGRTRAADLTAACNWTHLLVVQHAYIDWGADSWWSLAKFGFSLTNSCLGLHC